MAAEHEDILRFWFDRGVAGVRIDSAALLVKDPELGEEQLESAPGEHPFMDRDPLHVIYRGWRAIADGYPEPRVLIGEICHARLPPSGPVAAHVAGAPAQRSRAVDLDLRRRPGARWGARRPEAEPGPGRLGLPGGGRRRGGGHPRHRPARRCHARGPSAGRAGAACRRAADEGARRTHAVERRLVDLHGPARRRRRRGRAGRPRRAARHLAVHLHRRLSLRPRLPTGHRLPARCPRRCCRSTTWPATTRPCGPGCSTGSRP